MSDRMAKMAGVYSSPENEFPKTPKDAALEMFEADMAVAEAEEDEAVGWGYDQSARDRLERACQKYREITGKDAPCRGEVSSEWLFSHAKEEV